AFARCHVVAVYSRRGGVAREHIERFRIVALATETCRGSDPWKVHVAKRFSSQIVNPDQSLGVLEVRNNEAVAHDIDFLDGLRSLRNDYLPVLGGGAFG